MKIPVLSIDLLSLRKWWIDRRKKKWLKKLLDLHKEAERIDQRRKERDNGKINR